MAPRSCVISTDCFCIVCGEFIGKSQERDSDVLRKVNFAFFKLKFGHQDKSSSQDV